AGQHPRPVAQRRGRRRGHVFAHRAHPGRGKALLDPLPQVVEIVVPRELREAEQTGHEIDAVDRRHSNVTEAESSKSKRKARWASPGPAKAETRNRCTPTVAAPAAGRAFSGSVPRPASSAKAHKLGSPAPSIST